MDRRMAEAYYLHQENRYVEELLHLVLVCKNSLEVERMTLEQVAQTKEHTQPSDQSANSSDIGFHHQNTHHTNGNNNTDGVKNEPQTQQQPIGNDVNDVIGEQMNELDINRLMANVYDIVVEEQVEEEDDDDNEECGEQDSGDYASYRGNQ